MKKTLICLLSVLVMLFCLPMLSASAAQEPVVGIDGNKKIDMTEGYASGYGWEMVFNRRDGVYTLTLTEGHFGMITCYSGDLCVNIPAGASVSVGYDADSYALGVQNGTMTINGTGNLSLIGQNGLIALNGNIIVNGPTISSSATNRAVYCSNGSLTINGGSVNATGVNAGVETTGGLYVNGGSLRAVATSSASTAAGIRVKDSYFKMAAGSVSANGVNAIYALQANIGINGGSLTAYGSSYGLYTGPETAGSTASGKTVLSVSDGDLIFSGAKTGVYLCNNSAFDLSGGTVACHVTVGLDVDKTYGLQLDKSDLHISGGILNASGYQSISIKGLSADANAQRCKAFEMSGGFINTSGSDTALRFYDTTTSVTGGVIHAAATVNSGIYAYASDLLVSGGTIVADGGLFGINSHSAHPVISGGTVIADGDNYGFFCMGQITVENGSVTAVGGNTGIAASTDMLAIGSSSESRASLKAIGGSYAVAGAPVMLFGRTYGDYTSELNYKMLSFVDGAESYRSDKSCVLKINGSPADIVANMNAGNVNVSYNEGGSAASYKWMLQKGVNGRYVLTLNGASLAGIEAEGAIDIVLRNAASALTGEWKMNNAYVRLTCGSNSLSVTNITGNAINMSDSVFVHDSGTLDLRAPMAGYGSGFVTLGTVYGNHRNETASFSGSHVSILNATVQNSDSTALIALRNSTLQGYGSDLISTGVAGTAIDAEGCDVFFERCSVSFNGGAGIAAGKLTATDSVLSVTDCVSRAIAAGTGGVLFDNCTVVASSQEESVFTQGDAHFISTELRADSADGVKAVFLNAAPDSLAQITVSGHSLIKSGKEPVRISDANGVASYFANEDVALSSVYISNEHNYAQSQAYIYCNTVGNAVMSCTYNNCTCTLTKVLPAVSHDFSVYISNNDATCSTDGTKTATCPICLTRDTVVDVDSKAPHTFVDYKTNNDATCLTDGTKTATCQYCDAVDTLADVGSALGHDYEVVVVSGDCANNVWTKMVCKRCDYETEAKDTGSLGDHKWDESRGCTQIRYCSVCNYTDGRILQHAYSDFVADNNATCTTAGTLSAVCARCGEKQSVTDPDAPAKGHEPDRWVVINAPTAYATGLCALVCKQCPMRIETKVIPLCVVPLDDSIIKVDNEKFVVFVAQSGIAVSDFTAKLDNALNVFVMNASGTLIEDDALLYTGATVKVTNNGQLYTVAVLGDVSGDGVLTADDARSALRISVGLDAVTDAQISAGDLDSNGTLTANDARSLLRRSVGLAD